MTQLLTSPTCSTFGVATALLMSGLNHPARPHASSLLLRTTTLPSPSAAIYRCEMVIQSNQGLDRLFSAYLCDPTANPCCPAYGITPSPKVGGRDFYLLAGGAPGAAGLPFDSPVYSPPRVPSIADP